MSRWEKAGILCGYMALIVSIASPIATYLWLDPKVQELKHWPVLSGNVQEVVRNSDMLHYVSITFSNTGDMPATGITVNMHLAEGVRIPTTKEIKVLNPYPYDITIEDRRVSVFLKTGLKSNDSCAIEILLTVENEDKLIHNYMGSFSGEKPYDYAIKCQV